MVAGWAATKVPLAPYRTSPIEKGAIAMLLLLVLLQAGMGALALGEQTGLIAGHRTYIVLLAATVQPYCAAAALFTLLLIAHDFWVELRRLVHTDPLTGVLNRLGFDHAAQTVLRGRGRRSLPVSICIADIDGFKRINDDHGHAAGDAALACFAGHLAGMLRDQEHVARIGGEEFAILLPGCDGRDAYERMQPVREGLADLVIDEHPEISLRASFGVAQCAPGDTIVTVLERADQALYTSKRSGRNRVTLLDAPERAARA
jgi:diguanylate cyclase (GGDEF)-like protein